MKRFRITIAACILLAVLVPFPEYLAVSHDTPLYTHLAYVFGHEGWLHYIINAWSLLAMHNLFRWYRVISAYLFAVALTFFALPPQPMIGASTFTCFFFGFTAPWLWRKERLALFLMVVLLLLTCILPGFAGIPHVTAFSFGVVFSLAEGYTRRIHHYLTH